MLCIQFVKGSDCFVSLKKAVTKIKVLVNRQSFKSVSLCMSGFTFSFAILVTMLKAFGNDDVD